MMATILDDRYELQERLGEGGMARVHRATDRTLDRTVAVKILAPRFARDPEFVERFRREARAAAALNHPNVVAVYDTGEDGGSHFIVMEHVEGRTLADVLSEEERLPPDRVAAIGAAACEGLEAAHRAGLVHRDVKPANIMVDDEGRVKVADFGIARADSAETLTGAKVLGTAAYLSPEQAAGKPVDARSDLYSLGCVLQHMIVGSPPFTGTSPVAVAAKHVRDEPPPLPDTVPAELRGVVERSLAKDPDDRFSTAAEMGAALQGVGGLDATVPIAGGDTQVMETPPPEPPHRRRWLLPVALLALALLAGIVAFTAFSGDEGRDRRRGANQRQSDRDTSPSPSPEPTEAPPPTVADAQATLEAVLAQALTDGAIEEKVGEDVAKRADEAIEKHAEGKIDEALKKIEEAREKLVEGVEKEEAAPEAAADIDAALDALGVAIQNEPPPSGEANGEENGEGPEGEGPPGQEKKEDD